MTGLHWLFVGVAFLPSLASAESKGRLTLEAYLQEVRSKGPEARGLQEAVLAAELRLNEADGSLSPEGYVEYKLLDDKKESNSAFAPSRTQNDTWKIGVRDESRFGLSTNAYYTTGNTTLSGVSPQVPMITDFASAAAALELKQSLWRNSFGVATRADLKAKRAASRIEMLRQKMTLKNLLLKAENTYWSLASFHEIVKLQLENVDRARKLRDRMARQASLRLYDDVDAMQAQASLETRELELQSSLDERASLIRQFNTLRGTSSDAAEDLAELPTNEFMLKQSNNPARRMSREDLRIAFEEADASRLQAEGSISRIYPQLDLTASIATNGLDQKSAMAREEVQNLHNPTWMVGLVFSVPLDFGLLGNMKHSYEAQRRSAVEKKTQAAFNEERVWDDLIQQKREAQGRFQRSISLEKLQTQLVEKERQRLMNGRTTTFQAITFEQNLALAQIARVRAQLTLLQIHNVIKTFEEQL
jgi:outer membrane protein TolC